MKTILYLNCPFCKVQIMKEFEIIVKIDGRKVMG